MFTKDLTLNVLNFDHAARALTVHIGRTQTQDSVKLSLQDCSSLSDSFDNATELFCSFEQPTADSKKISRPVSSDYCSSGEVPWSFSFMKKYYTFFLTRHFRAKGIPASNNFVSDTEVWIKSKSPYPGFDGYRVFTLRVQFNRSDRKPELLVASGDVSSVYAKPIIDPLFAEISEELFNRVLFQNRIYRYDHMPDTARRHMEEVYPCVSFDLLRALNISRPAPDKSNRYLKYSREIDDFRKNFLEDDTLRDFMLISTDWKQVQPQRLDLSGMKLLRFGEGEHAEPKYGVRQFGPKELMAVETVFFFIMHEDDKPLAFTLNEYLLGKRSEFAGGLGAFLRMKYNTEPKLSIVFSDKDNPLKEIEEKLGQKQWVDGRQYVAIYLSPYSKWTRNIRHKSIYYRIKEALLMKGIVSQTVEVDKTWGSGRLTVQEGGYNKAVIKDGFHYSLPNILVAIYAKLGATPWCFQTPPTDELVIGISAYRSRDLDRNYLGSAFSFTSEGRFQGFECFRNSQINELAGSIALTVKEYCDENDQLKKLVIHFYKRLSWRELKPIEKALSELGLHVPVVVVSVNKSFSEDIVGFDHAKAHKMPVAGTFLPVESNQYLLFNNQLQQGDEKINDREGYPFPLKITIQQFEPGNNRYVVTEPSEVEVLLTQVCRFSQLYWKSVSRQWILVTLKYPEMLAQIVPHFKRMDMPELGRENLWFL
jgi:hypothetical protein